MLHTMFQGNQLIGSEGLSHFELPMDARGKEDEGICLYYKLTFLLRQAKHKI